MALFDPSQDVLLSIRDDRFSTIRPIMRPVVLLVIVVLVVKLSVWINNGSTPMSMVSFPAISFSLIGSGVLVFALSVIRSQRRTRYQVYLNTLPNELITLQTDKMDPDSRREIATWEKNQKANHHE
ncbi:hypothetical protein AB7W88_02605 [Providencia vermicola]|uniref:hypothetical protein n=1 Tax=Providencia TaxID=586 RepID=UPI0032DB83F2